MIREWWPFRPLNWLIAAMFWGFAATAAQASCLGPGQADSRLVTYCLVSEAQGRVVALPTAREIDVRLHREGILSGPSAFGEHDIDRPSVFAYPIVEYSRNLNGGNPRRPLVLGDLVFEGDPELYRQSGVAIGGGFLVNGRYIYGSGRYVDYEAGGSVAKAPRFNATIARGFGSLCSKNHVSRTWFIDACIGSSNTKREVTHDRRRAASLSSVRLVRDDGRNYHQLTGGLRRVFEGDYDQNQMVFEVQTIRPGGVYTSIEATIGEAVENELATRQSVSATVGTSLVKRPLRATLSLSHSDGGKLLGIDRADQSQSIAISYTLTPRLTLSLGYRQTDSSIDYFDDADPTFGIQFAPIAF
jgi:hypothetical protein